MEETSELRLVIDRLTTQVGSLAATTGNLAIQVSTLAVEMSHMREESAKVEKTPQDIALINQRLDMQEKVQATQRTMTQWIIGLGVLMVGTAIAGMGLVVSILPHLK